jgi:iron complex outermembrane receptor protein
MRAATDLHGGGIEVRRRHLGFVSATALLIAAAAAPGIALAQSAPAHQTGATALGEVVITAERREQSLQRAAVAVTAVSGQQLAKRDIVNMDQLTQAAPALQAQQGTGPYTSVIVRGITTAVVNVFGDPSVAVNLDGVYLARPTSLHGLFYDLDRVEVLKGPQGTLYGRNATGGAVNLVSHEPSYSLGGDLQLEYGNYNQFLAQGDLNAPLARNVAARIAFQTVRHDGYFSDGTGDEDQQAVRLSLRADPSAALKLLLRADYSHENDRGQGATAYCSAASPVPVNRAGQPCPVGGGFYGPSPWTSIVQQSKALTPAGLAPLPDTAFNKGDHWGVSNETDWKVLGGVLTFIPAFRSDDVSYLSPVAGGMIREIEHSHQTSAELRFASSDAKPLRYILGGYLFNGATSGNGIYDAQNAGVNPVQALDVSDFTYALFGQATWAVTGRLRLVGGVRYTYERKKTDSQNTIYTYFTPQAWPLVPPTAFPLFGFPTVGSRSWDQTNWKAGFEFDLAPKSLLYANVSTGFKAGGFYFNPIPGAPNTYDPEKVTAYTAGLKNRFLDDRLQLNLEAFDLEYTGQQIATLLFAQLGPALIPYFPNQNAGKAQIRGGELDSQFLLTPNTLLGADVQYIDAKYKSLVYQSGVPAQVCPSTFVPPPNGPVFSVDCSGRPELMTPKWTINLSAEQTFPLPGGGDLVLGVNTRHESGRYTNLNYAPFTFTPGYWRTNATLTYDTPSRRFSVTAFVNNIENKAVPEGVGAGLNFPTIPLLPVTLKPPRTFGLRVGAHY